MSRPLIGRMWRRMRSSASCASMGRSAKTGAQKSLRACLTSVGPCSRGASSSLSQPRAVVPGSGSTWPNHCHRICGNQSRNHRRGAGRNSTLAAAALDMPPSAAGRREPLPAAAPGLRCCASVAGPTIATPRSLCRARSSRARTVVPSSLRSLASAGQRAASRRRAAEVATVQGARGLEGELCDLAARARLPIEAGVAYRRGHLSGAPHRVGRRHSVELQHA